MYQAPSFILLRLHLSKGQQCSADFKVLIHLVSNLCPSNSFYPEAKLLLELLSSKTFESDFVDKAT